MFWLLVFNVSQITQDVNGLNVLTKVLIDSLKMMIYANVFNIYIWSRKAVICFVSLFCKIFSH